MDANRVSPVPYNLRDGRDEPGGTGPKVVRGGSWYDRPKRARSSFRMNYQPWQPVKGGKGDSHQIWVICGD